MRLVFLENWLLNNFRRHNPTPGLIQDFLPRLLHSDKSFDELIKTESFSRRQLERKFQQEIGLAPGYLKQLHRIKVARYLITVNPLASLTDIAQDCGFYDQAHFIRQFQKITGQTPGQYKKKKLMQQERMSQKYNR